MNLRCKNGLKIWVESVHCLVKSARISVQTEIVGNQLKIYKIAKVLDFDEFLQTLQDKPNIKVEQKKKGSLLSR